MHKSTVMESRYLLQTDRSMWPFRKRPMIDIDENPMSVEIYHQSDGEDLAVLALKGCVRTCDMEILREAIIQFEKRVCMIFYVSLRQVRYLCPNAIVEILELRSRIERRGDIFDIVDIGVEAESAIHEMGFWSALRPLYPWRYSVTAS